MFYKQYFVIACWLLLSGFPLLLNASVIYNCTGRFNTASDYLHVYVVSDKKDGGYLSWNGTRFKFQEDPVWIYAEYIGDTRTDVVYIEKETLHAKFYSILPGLILHAEGTCKTVKPTLLEFRKKYLDIDEETQTPKYTK